MFRFAPYILKSLWRHRVRTLLTMSGAAVALFVFTMVGTVQRSLDELKKSGDRTLIVFEANKFCPLTSRLQEDYEKRIKKEVKGVRDVLPIQVFTNNCRASLDVAVFYGVPPERLRAFRDFELIAGDWSDFHHPAATTVRQESAIIGAALANRRGLNVGDRFTIGGITVNVAGIFKSEDKSEENYIYTHLKFLQKRGGKSREGTVTQFEVKLADSADPESISTKIDGMFRGKTYATDTRTKGAFQASALADLFEMIEMAHVLGYACVVLMIVMVATTSFMSVHDRIREHAILQTIGFTPRQVFSIVMLESVAVSLLGGMLGVGSAMLLLMWSPLSLGAEAVAVTFAPSYALAGIGVVLAFVLGVVAGICPAWQAARAEIVPSLRRV